MMSAPRGRSSRFAFSAAGFIATRTSGASPGVRMSWSAKCSWKLDTPGSVPAGARISAGKFGSVDRSFPNVAVSWVNRSPASCIPSPESPANLIITRSSCWICLVTVECLLRAPRPHAAATAYRSGAAPRRRGASQHRPGIYPLAKTRLHRNLCRLSGYGFATEDRSLGVAWKLGPQAEPTGHSPQCILLLTAVGQRHDCHMYRGGSSLLSTKLTDGSVTTRHDYAACRPVGSARRTAA